jgi:hypothetical protein
MVNQAKNPRKNKLTRKYDVIIHGWFSRYSYGLDG